jgi:hypothetical protein
MNIIIRAAEPSDYEGTHRREAFRNGEYVDDYSMARLKLGF